MVVWAFLATIAQAQPVDAGGAAQDALQHPARLYAALVYGLILLVIVVFGTWALVLFSRRYRDRLRHKPAESTPVPDVWSMHKPPDVFDPDEQDREPDDEP